MTTLTCLYCQQPFEQNKYSKRQKVCSKPECQHARQLASMKEWREKHPDYFKYDESKGEEWLKTQRERSRQWRQRNPDKIRAYRQTHLDDYRNYMREYMKKYRDRKRAQGGAAPQGQGPAAGGNPTQFPFSNPNLTSLPPLSSPPRPPQDPEAPQTPPSAPAL